jgi:photosystem II stability/assembly factor-like uncharacterized protein
VSARSDLARLIAAVAAVGWLGTAGAQAPASAPAAGANPAVAAPDARPAAAAADRNLLTLPAIESKRAARGMLLEVVRAGKRYVAVGERGVVVYSDDGGKSWTQAKVPVSATLTGVSFATPELGWAVGHEGIVIATTDGGRTWTRLVDGSTLLPQLIDYAAAQADATAKALAQAKPADKAKAQEAADAADEVLGDAEAGLKFGPSRPLLDVLFTSPTNGFAVGAYGLVFRTADGGKSWKLIADKVGYTKLTHFNAVAATPSGKLFLAGEAGTVYRSDDGGETWRQLSTPYKGSYYGLVGLTAPTGEVVLLYGFRGKVMRSADAGESWEEIATPARSSLYGSAVLEDGTVVLSGAAGALIASRDAGKTFSAAGGAAARGLNVGIADAGGGQVVVAGAAGVRTVAVAERAGAKQ